MENSRVDSLTLVLGEQTGISEAIEQPIGSDRLAGRDNESAVSIEAQAAKFPHRLANRAALVDR